MKVYAVKGRPYNDTERYIDYFCGTYTVNVVKKSIAEEIANLADEFLVDAQLRKYYLKRRILNPKLNRKFYFKSTAHALSIMERNNLLLSGTGDDYPRAVKDLLDKVSIWPTVRPETGDDEMVAKNKEYFKALVDRSLLSVEEERVLSYLESKAKILRHSSLQAVHSDTMYQKTYTTVQSLLEHPDFADIEPYKMYFVVHNLFMKHCIVFYDNKPMFQYPPGELNEFHEFYLSDMCFGNHNSWFL